MKDAVVGAAEKALVVFSCGKLDHVRKIGGPLHDGPRFDERGWGGRRPFQAGRDPTERCDVYLGRGGKRGGGRQRQAQERGSTHGVVVCEEMQERVAIRRSVCSKMYL